MELNRQTAQITVLICTIVFVNAWQCKTLNCLIYPLSLKLWKDHVEVSAKSLRVQAGSSFSITCDGSCVGTRENPHLRWYGTDRRWIAYEGAANRVHVEQSLSSRFLKLHIGRVAVSDQGEYICRGWLGKDRGWDTKSIRLIVGQSDVPPSIRHDPTTAVHIAPTAPPSSQSSTRVILSTTGQTCSHPNFKCGSGECLDMHEVCDAVPNCEDASDESNCAGAICTEDMIACTDQVGCVTTSQICDGTQHCNDGSDEDPDVCRSK